MIIDMTAIGVLISLALNSINILVQLRTMLSSGEKKLDERLGKVETWTSALERRVQTAEADIRHMPDKDTVQKLQVDLAEMKAQMTAMVKSSEATERATRRVEDFLIKRGAD